MNQPLTMHAHLVETTADEAADGASIPPGRTEEIHHQPGLSDSRSTLELAVESGYTGGGSAAHSTGTYTVPIDPMEALQCDACQ